MGDWPDLFHPLVDEWMSIIATGGPNGTLSRSGAASAAWPSANLAIYCPVHVPRRCTIQRAVAACGATGGGNFDLGLFDWAGNKLVSTGSTARSANSEVYVNVTDTEVGPGRYWIGLSVDGTNTMICYWSALNSGMGKMSGFRQQASAFALPSAATFATVGQSLWPAAGFLLRPE